MDYEIKLGLIRHILYYAILQSTLQPLHHQPTSLIYDGAQAMDVTGRDRHGSPVRVRPPEGNSEEEYRTVGQDMR